MINNKCEVCIVLPNNTPVYETKSWVVSLNPDQAYLGRCYVTLKKHKGDLADLTDSEWLEFADIVKTLEAAVRHAFGATLFNWVCLMNNAFQTEHAKPHIHWHFRPRYDHKVTFSGTVFSDPSFGHHYDRTHVKKVLPKTLGNINKIIKKQFS
ncbi:HIT family protein [Candidatus Saccharibacteria bacterium]|nr:HIT family protein [Candidatus Saccharibacteria bacterium]